MKRFICATGLEWGLVRGRVRRSVSRGAVLGIATALAAQTATATLLLTDDFTSYTAGSALGGQGSWTKSGSGPDASVQNTNVLTYSGYNGGGGAYVQMPAASGTSSKDYKGFTSTTAIGNTFYVSFLLRLTGATASGDYFLTLGDPTTGTVYGPRLFAKASGAGFVLGTSKAGNTANYGSTVLAFNTTHVVVIKFTGVSGTLNDTAYVWANPSLASEPSTGSAECSDTSGTDAGYSGGNIGNFLWHNRSANNPAGAFDAVRVAAASSSATAWTDLAAQQPATAPSVSTVAASATNTTSSTVNGNVTADGGATVTDRGVCYKTGTGVTITDNKTASGSGTGTFSVNLSSLSVNQVYYFRAYATNTAGATLGSELSFTTLANVPGAPTVGTPSATSLDVAIAANGNPAGTVFAILCTNSGQYVQSSGALGGSAVWQTAATWGTKTVTGLSSSQEYGFQVKARNGENVETAFGAVGNGTTSAGAPTPTAPTVSAPTAAAIGTTSATLGGTIDSTNNASVTERGIYWSTSSGFTPPAQGTAVLESGSFGNGAFTEAVSGLPAGSTIYYKAYATNSAGAGYSTEASFSTVPAAPAIAAASSVGIASFQANWGSATGATNYLVDVATDSGFAAFVPGFSALAVGNVLSTSVTGLSPAVAYYYRVRTQAVGGTSTNSATQTVSTLATTATVSTASISAITTTTASGGGTIAADGGAAVSARGVCWNTGGTPTTADSTSSDGTGTGAFSSSLTGLTPGRTYYVRAYAVNGAGTSYGAEVSFTASCPAGAPTGIHADPTNSTSFTAVWDAYAGAVDYRLDVSTSSSFTSLSGGATLLSEGFASGTTPPAGWTFTAIGGTYSSAGNFGAASPALQFDATGDRIETPTFADATNLTLWLKGQSVGAASSLLIEKFDGSSWSTVVNSNNLPGVGTTWSIPLDSTATKLRITYTKSSGNLALDDVKIMGNTSAPSYVAGFSNRVVAGLSDVVTGLTQGVTYYMRVRGLGTYCTSANSTNGSATTVVLTPNVHFATATSSTDEGAGTVQVPVQVSFAADATVQVAVAASSTATDGSDFNLASTQIVFVAGGATQQNVAVTLTDDTTIETAETISLNLVAGLGAVVQGQTNHVMTVADNEPSVQFTYAATNVLENAGSLQVVVYKSSTANNVAGQLTLGGQASDPSDYTLSATNFTLNGATTSATFTVTLVNNGISEFSEYLNLTLTNLVGASTGTPSSVAILIEDDADGSALLPGDIAVVGFHMTDPDDFAFVALTNIPGGTVIKFTDKGWNGTGLVGNEGTIEWQAPGGGITGGTVVAISNLTDSGAVQAIGNFSLATGGDQILAYQGAESSPTFLFGLNDRLSGIWQGSYTNTNDSMLPSGLVNGTTAIALTNTANARYSGSTTGDRTALQSAICSPANWSSSATRSSIVLPAAPFVITSPQPEMAVLGVNLAVIASGDATPSTADGTDFGTAVLVGVQVDHVFTVTNTGAAALTLSTPTLGGAGAAHFSLQSAPAGTVASGSATPFTVRFDPSATGVHTATVSIVNDDADENPYTFTIVGTGAAGPAVSFGFATTSGVEGGSAVAIPVNVASTYDVTVQVAVASGTATLSSDYTLSTTQLVFTAGGATSQTLSVSVVDDAVVEVDETFVLQIANIGGGVTGSPASVTFTITDNDAAPSLSAGDIAIIGRQLSSGGFSILALTNLSAGQVIYFTDNGWSNTQFRNTANQSRGNEDLVRLTINSNIAQGLIIRTADTSDGRWTWTTSGAIPATNSGNFNVLTLAQAGDQIYAFTATAQNPLPNPTAHLFVLDSTGAFEPANSSNQGDVPPGLSSNAGTAVSFAYPAYDVLALDLGKAWSTSFATKAGWLGFIANAANWVTNGTLPSGSVYFGLSCSAGIAPRISSVSSVSVNAGSNVSFTVSADDPTCFAPSLSASNLPSGGTFSPTVSGTNRSGTFSWTPSVANTGVTLVVFFASDGTLTTQRTVRINVGTASDSWSAGVPASLVNWSVPVTNLIAGSSGNATVQWVSATGAIYQVYATESTPGAGVTPWTLVGTVTGGASAASFASTGGTTQKFYQVVLAGDTPSTNGIWGVVRPTLAAGFNFFGAPLSGDRALNGTFGASLAAALTGDPNGVGTPPGDELHVYQPGTGWLSFYLNGGVWYESGGAVATAILEPGVGVLLLRNGAAVQPVFTGSVGNRGTSTNTISAGWNIVALSEGRALPVTSAFDNDAQGTPTGDYDETAADIVAIHNPANGSWRRLQRLPTGQWMDLQTFTIVSNLYLLPGQAVYYFRQSGDLKVRF